MEPTVGYTDSDQRSETYWTEGHMASMTTVFIRDLETYSIFVKEHTWGETRLYISADVHARVFTSAII
jgi:hypothetical protein